MEDNLFIFSFKLGGKLKNNKYFTFTIRSIVFFGLLFTLDFTIGNTLKYFYFKQESGLQYRTTYSMEQTKADLLVFGSSRANHHYHPDVLEEELKISYYNVGRDGNFIFYHFAVLKSVLKRYKPKIIVLDFVEKEFEKKQESYDRLSSLLPYYNSHPEIRQIVEFKSSFEKIKLISHIYPYNSALLTIAVGNTKANKRRKSDYKGYVPLNNKFKESKLCDVVKEGYELDSLKIDCFKSFIFNCKKNNIELFVVCSPYFNNHNARDPSILIAKEISRNNKINFLDFSNDSSFVEKKNLFADEIHLNEEGAKKFTKNLSQMIKKIKI